MTQASNRAEAPLEGPVLVVGAGLIGASVAMATVQTGIETFVSDVDSGVAHVAASRAGASDGQPERDPQLIVVATPPNELSTEIAAALAAYPTAVVTDVGSVKGRPLAELEARGIDLNRYVGGHPMAGSERSGPMASSPDLFEGRTWAVISRPDVEAGAATLVEALARSCGATVVHLTTEEHDLAVARTSHLPHLLAALAAGQLRVAPESHLALSGQGVRDVTRIAAGDPALWRQIVTSNSAALVGLLTEVRDGLDGLLSSLDAGDGDHVEAVLAAGLAGTTRIPGKHGGPILELAEVAVAIPDQPGALAKLFADTGNAGVNIEDLRIDHDPGRAYGHVEIDVAVEQADRLVEALVARGWSAHR